MIPTDVPSDLPAIAPAVIVVGLSNGGTLYRLFETGEQAQHAWDDGEVKLAHGEKAYLFVGGILLAFHSVV